MSAIPRGAWSRPAQHLSLVSLLLLDLLLLSPLAHAAFISFEDCLSTGIINSYPNPKQLQWVPLFVNAVFDSAAPNNLSLVLYGNVSGQQVQGAYPPPDSPDWSNPNITFGKITNVGSADEYSTLLAKFNDLSYTAYNAKASRFCSHLVNGSCPLGPAFNANASDPYGLPSFELSHDFGSAYRFSTLAATIKVISGDVNAPDIVCVSATITPDLGPNIAGLITWLPATILILKGLATLSAAIWSPWGSSDIFRWSSNYGRDEDLLRLVTPGFGDCLQYIQFATLLGSLTLQYPGFFQPALSQTAWSLLLFNQSFVSHGKGTQSLIDGLYTTNSTLGIGTMQQLIGMTREDDVWACMAVWLLVIIIIVVLLCQLGFLGRWIFRMVTRTTEEDLRQKNLPFTVGNIVRLLFNFFIIPIVAISLYQLVISSRSPISVVVCAAILLAIIILGGGWMLRIIFSTKPPEYLFDDMPTVLLYGPLYNTYSDSAAPFALVPVLITFMRGVAIGAVQPSGVAQIIILAICEVILILTLNGFRPFQAQTSMNAYQTSFAVVRLVTVLLCVAFVSSLGVSEAAKGWVGYVILLFHACVLLFGFFLNTIQTLIEVVARSTGIAGHDAQTGAIRGSILNWRMLKKRRDRRPATAGRSSMTSHAAMLQPNNLDDAHSGRSRSMSASSQQLLNQVTATPSMHRLSGFESFPSDGVGSPGAEEEGGTSYLGAARGGSMSGRKPGMAVRTEEATFYRPPRKRTNTMDILTPGAKSRTNDPNTPEVLYQDSPGHSTDAHTSIIYDEHRSGGKDSPAPAYFRDRADSNENVARTDYAVREVDQYYRGPALSDQRTRKLKTGPADPEGPAASAHSWFQRLFLGVQNKKNKDTGKGFEVVRSSRMPPGMQQDGPGTDAAAGEAVEMQTSPPMNQEPYRDSPPLQQGEMQAGPGAERSLPPPRLDVTEQESPQQNFDFGFGAPAPEISRGGHAGAARILASRDGAAAAALASSSSAAARSPPRFPLPPQQTQPLQKGKPGPMHPGLRAEQSLVDLQLRPTPRPSQDDRSSRYTGRPSSDYDASPRPSTDQWSPQAGGQTGGGGAGLPPHLRISDVPSLNPIEPVGGFDLPSRFNSRRTEREVEEGQNYGGRGGDMSPITDSGPDWLRDVEGLSWNHASRPAQPSGFQPIATATTNTPSPSRFLGARTPSLPRRSHRRTPSHPFDDFRQGNDEAEGFSPIDAPSEEAADDDDGSARRELWNPSHHRAMDSIHRNSFGAEAAMRGTSASVEVGSPPEDDTPMVSRGVGR